MCWSYTDTNFFASIIINIVCIMIIIIPSCIEWLWKVSLLSFSRLSMVKSLYLSYLYRLHRICNGFFANYIALHCHYINLHYSSPEQLQTGTYCKAFSRFWTRIISQIAYDTNRRGERYPHFLIEWIYCWIESCQFQHFESNFELICLKVFLIEKFFELNFLNFIELNLADRPKMNCILNIWINIVIIYPTIP